MIRNLLAGVGLVGLALAAAVGIQAYDAWDDDAPPRVAVSYRGLDLTHPHGVALLERRVDAAIADVCPADTGSVLGRYGSQRDCRRRAWAGVEPQIARAIAAAEARDADDDRRDEPPLNEWTGNDRRWDGDDRGWSGEDDRAAADRALAPYPVPAPAPPPPPVVADKPVAPGRLVRRTVTTTTVTTTTVRGAPVAASPTARVTRVVVKRPTPRAPTRLSAYARRSGPGTYLPPRAWTAVELAATRVARRGGTVAWSVPGRRGIVTAGPLQRVGKRLCRQVRAVKYAYGGRIVVADGCRCRPGR